MNKNKIIDLLGLSEFKEKIISLIPTKTSQLTNDSITASSIGAAKEDVVGVYKNVFGQTDIEYSYPEDAMVKSYIGENNLNTALKDSTRKIADEVIKIEEKFKSFESAKSKIVGSAFGKKLGLTSDSKIEDIATDIDEVNASLLWENTENGTYKFEQSGARWIANNRGINSSTATSTWTVTVPKETFVFVGYRTATESGYDKLTITLNGKVIIDNLSGACPNESSAALKLVAGKNTLVATYYKDSSNSKNGDMAYVILPPIGEQTGMYRYQSKSVTPNVNTQTVVPDNGYDGLYAVTVSAAEPSGIYYSADGNFKSVMDSLGTSPGQYTVDNFKCVAPNSITGTATLTNDSKISTYSSTVVTSNLSITYDNVWGVVSGVYEKNSASIKNHTGTTGTISVSKKTASGYIFSPSGNW